MIHEVSDQQEDWQIRRSISEEFNEVNEVNRTVTYLTASLQSTEHKTLKVKLCANSYKIGMFQILQKAVQIKSSFIIFILCWL
jgi:hypothetical protein